MYGGEAVEEKHEHQKNRVQTKPLRNFELIRIKILFDTRILCSYFRHRKQ